MKQIPLIFSLLLVLLCSCGEDEKLDYPVGGGEYVIDLLFDGVTPRYASENPYYSMIDLPQEGKSFKITGSAKDAKDIFISAFCSSSDPSNIIYLAPYESFTSEELKISYTFTDGIPKINIEVSANQTDEERRIDMLVGDPYCSNGIVITQPGLPAGDLPTHTIPARLI